MADINHTGQASSLEGLCRSAIALQGAADPHWDVVNETAAGTLEHCMALAHAQQLADVAEQLVGRAAAIPAGRRVEVIGKARLVASFAHSAMGPSEALSVSLAHDVLRLLAAQ